MLRTGKIKKAEIEKTCKNYLDNWKRWRKNRYREGRRTWRMAGAKRLTTKLIVDRMEKLLMGENGDRGKRSSWHRMRNVSCKLHRGQCLVNGCDRGFLWILLASLALRSEGFMNYIKFLLGVFLQGAASIMEPKTICKEISLNLTQRFCYVPTSHLSNSAKRRVHYFKRIREIRVGGWKIVVIGVISA